MADIFASNAVVGQVGDEATVCLFPEAFVASVVINLEITLWLEVDQVVTIFGEAFEFLFGLCNCKAWIGLQIIQNLVDQNIGELCFLAEIGDQRVSA